ncbi:hypothetical protein JW851_03710 [Candidatus Woesearchaeota archaeon]|nr:hypothetical protein [Candidatus Woesearchaeota archaeon]
MAKIKATEYIKTRKSLTGARAMSELYEIKILHNFTAHQILLKNGISIASYNHLRSIYETILKIYLNITYPDLGNINFEYETRENNTEISKDKIKQIEENYKRNKSLKTCFIEKKLYSKGNIQLTRKFYHGICSFVHPSIKSMSACYEFQPNTFIDSYKLGIGLTNSNFMILFELYRDKIRRKYKKKVLSIFNEYPKFIPEGIPILTPSINRERLMFKSYAELIEYLKRSG